MDFTFKALQDDFTGVWPAVMRIENPEFTARVFYAGANPDASSDVGVYAADRAAGRLDRRNLSSTCKPKDPLREMTLCIRRGRVVLQPVFGTLICYDLNEARHFVEDMTATIASAEALDDFITARFGPIDID